MSNAELIKDLKSPNASVRAEAAYTLGEKKTREAVIALIDALTDEQSSVRSNSAWALGEIGDSSALDPIIECYQEFKNDWHRKNYRQSKFATTYLYAIVKLMEFSQLNNLFETGDQYEKVVALHEISQRTHPESIDKLRNALEHEDVEVRKTASELLELRLNPPDVQTSDDRNS